MKKRGLLRKKRNWGFGVVLLLTFLAACSPENTLRGVFKKQTPYEKYLEGLREANLGKTALAQEWVEAGQRALQKPVKINLPFKETAYFPAHEPQAAGYQFNVRRGQKVAVRVQTKGKDAPLVFLDLFEVSQDTSEAPNHVANADTASAQLEYEIDEELPHVLRVQPELLRSGQYTVTIETAPTLAFPVQGKDSRAVQSFWGAARDAGTRKHEGIDIFAPRNTPVVAAAEGYVNRVNTTPLGGKVVWLTDASRRQSLYYAHLDSQLVQVGQRVQAGDTLGLLGNTGNAKTTAPHLHFGVYRFGQGAVDPYPFVHQDRTKPATLQVNTDRFGDWTRIAKGKATLRSAPTGNSAELAQLNRHAPVQVLAGSGSWYRVQLEDGSQGYIAASLVEPVEKPLRTVRLPRQVPLLDGTYPNAAAKRTLPPDSTLRVLAVLDGFWLVKDAQGTLGWIAPLP